MGSPAINARRLLSDLSALARFGGRPDGGVDRVAGSPADMAARHWLAERVDDFGGVAHRDASGNVLGRTRTAVSPRLLVGSHSDTVPAGGRLDGAYGVISAWEVLRTLVESGHPAADRVEVVSFWDEEGASPTSPGGLTGSTALAGSAAVADVVAFLEMHVEQGPRMVEAGWELAVVESIVAIERHLITITGLPNHAGTTPMARRIDAGRAAAQVAVEVREVARKHPGMVANVGSIVLDPGSPNVIPGRGEVVTEFRCDRPEAIADAVATLANVAQQIADDHGCSATRTLLSAKPAVRFDLGLSAIAERVIRATGRPTTRLASYAGHDAGPLSAVRPTAMIFVPSVGGISHSPREHTPDALLVQGAQALLDVVVEIWRTRFGGPPR